MQKLRVDSISMEHLGVPFVISPLETVVGRHVRLVLDSYCILCEPWRHLIFIRHVKGIPLYLPLQLCFLKLFGKFLGIITALTEVNSMKAPHDCKY